MVSYNTLIGSTLSLLNDTSKLADPITNRTGSFFFGPNQEISFSRYMPKGKVTGGNYSTDMKSLGQNYKRNRIFNIHISLFTIKGIVDDNTGYKDNDLLYDYIEKIEQTIKENNRVFGNVGIGDILTEVDPNYDPERNVYYTQLLLPIKDRRT